MAALQLVNFFWIMLFLIEMLLKILSVAIVLCFSILFPKTPVIILKKVEKITFLGVIRISESFLSNHFLSARNTTKDSEHCNSALFCNFFSKFLWLSWKKYFQVALQIVKVFFQNHALSTRNAAKDSKHCNSTSFFDFFLLFQKLP